MTRAVDPTFPFSVDFSCSAFVTEWHQQQQFRHQLAGVLERGMLHMAGHFQFVSLRTDMTEPSLSKVFPDDRFSALLSFWFIRWFVVQAKD